jgi:hypothetical protein
MNALSSGIRAIAYLVILVVTLYGMYRVVQRIRDKREFDTLSSDAKEELNSFEMPHPANANAEEGDSIPPPAKQNEYVQMV